MIVTCPSCEAKYRVSESALQARGGRVKCANCANVWTVEDDALPLTEQVEEPKFEPSPDPEPQLEAEAEPAPEPEPSLANKPHAAIRRREEERKQKTRATVERAGWAGIAACFLAVVCSGYFMRTSVVEMWPRAAGAYAAIGLDVNPLGLVVEELKADLIDDHGTPVLLVEGLVRNITNAEKSVPPLLAQVLDGHGGVLAEWSLNLDSTVLGEGVSAPFTTRFAGPPEGGARVEVVLDPNAGDVAPAPGELDHHDAGSHSQDDHGQDDHSQDDQGHDDQGGEGHHGDDHHDDGHH